MARKNKIWWKKKTFLHRMRKAEKKEKTIQCHRERENIRLKKWREKSVGIKCRWLDRVKNTKGEKNIKVKLKRIRGSVNFSFRSHGRSNVRYCTRLYSWYYFFHLYPQDRKSYEGKKDFWQSLWRNLDVSENVH